MWSPHDCTGDDDELTNQSACFTANCVYYVDNIRGTRQHSCGNCNLYNENFLNFIQLIKVIKGDNGESLPRANLVRDQESGYLLRRTRFEKTTFNSRIKPTTSNN